MTNSLLPAAVIFTILCFAFALSAPEDNFTTNDGGSPEDSGEALSGQFSARRIILPSKLSREAKRNLISDGDKKVANGERSISFFGEKFDLFNIHKLFAYIESLLNQFNDESLDKSKIKIKNSTDNKLKDESRNIKKIELQNSENVNTLNEAPEDEKNQNSVTSDALKKSSYDRETPKLGKNNSLNPKKPAKNSKVSIRNSEDKDSMQKSKHGRKTKARNPKISDSLNNHEQYSHNEEMRNSGNNNILEKYSDDGEKKTGNTKRQNSSNNGTQLESISTVKSDKSKDLTTITRQNDEYINLTEITSDDTTTSNIPDEDSNECDDEDDNGKKVNENDVDECDDDDDDERENGNDMNTYNKNDNDFIIEDNVTAILPELLFQTVPDQQNSSKIYPRRKQMNNNDNVTAAKSQTVTNEENSFPEFELTSGEFIDDYINKRKRKIPGQSALNPSRKDATSEIISMHIPKSGNNFDENSRSSIISSSVNENTKSQSMLSEQLQNAGNNVWSEKNIVPSPIFNEDRKNTNSDQAYQNENFPRSMQDPFTPTGKTIKPSEKNAKVNDFEPLNLLSFHQKPHYNDLPYASLAPQEDYAIIEPPILNFQNNNPSVKKFHNKAPDISRSETEGPFQEIFDKAVPLENEGYLNGHYTNNFEDLKFPNRKNQQLEQKQPTVLQQNDHLNAQYVSNQDALNSPDKTLYLTNYKPETPTNEQTIEKNAPGMEMSSNYWISDNSQYNPSLNQNSSPADVESSLSKMDKVVPQIQPETIAPQNQMNEIEALSNPPLQNSASEQQILFPQRDIEKPLTESKTISRTSSNENKMKSGMIPTKEESKNVEFPTPQDDTTDSKGLPRSSFNITGLKVEHKPENLAIVSNTPKTITAKTKTTSNKPTNDELKKSAFFDESDGFNQKISTYDSDFSKINSPGESLNREYDKEDLNETDCDEEESYESEFDEEESHESENEEVSHKSEDNEESYEYDEEEEESNDFEYDEEESNEFEYDEEESNEFEYDEEESNEFEYDEEEPHDKHDEEETEKSTNISDRNINNTTTPITQEAPLTVENNVLESPGTFKTQNEETPSDKRENFDTILEYIYKHSDNPLFQGLQD